MRARPWLLIGWGAIPLLLTLSVDLSASAGLLLVDLVALSLVTVGVLDLTRPFDAPAGPVGGRRRVDGRGLLLEGAAVAAALGALVLALRLAVHRGLPSLAAGGLVVVAHGAVVVAAYRLTYRFVPERRGPLPAPGLALQLILAAIALPRLGAWSLIDPWEPHYGEVAREMIARHDWLSLWWAQDGFFFSKPPLALWLEGLSMTALGVPVTPGRILGASGELAAGAAPLAPEWALRYPSAALSLFAVHALYLALARRLGVRQGALAALLVALAPQWLLLGHQAMTDMPYVACLVVALSLQMTALTTSGSEPAPRATVRLGRGTLVELSVHHGVLALVVVPAIVQIAYLLTRHSTLALGHSPVGLHLHSDRVVVGSGLGNCGLPGNVPCGLHPPPIAGQPGLVAVASLLVLLGAVFLLRRETRLRPLLWIGSWALLALSFLAKGAPGLALGIAVPVVYLAMAGRLRELWDLRPVAAGLVLLTVAGPWYGAMVGRHGWPFLERLFLHDMVQRAFSHVHDTNGDALTGPTYYLWQLGYGLWPFGGLAVVGLVWALRPTLTARVRGPLRFLALWAALAFALFTIAGTKYHHYALPIVPPLAALAGVVLGHGLVPRWTTGAGADRRRRRWTLTAVALVIGIAIVGPDFWRAGADGADPSARLFHLVAYRYDRTWPAGLDVRPIVVGVGVLVAGLALVTTMPAVRRAAFTGIVIVAVAFGAWLSNGYLSALAPHFGQRNVLLAHARGPVACLPRPPPLVAYRLNWKGENFYTGNRLAAFSRKDQRLVPWLRSQRRSGVATVDVVVKHQRLPRLRRELAKAPDLRLATITTRSLNDKVALARISLAP